ncbi:MAG: GNAT family N-acetyltransferase, partial [Phycisphaerae bacterium]|nr:GNAT family N-acetyltransferase [Phycisphaerae bacterium]
MNETNKPSPDYIIRPIETTDRAWVAELLTQRWGAPAIAAHGELIQADQLPGFIAEDHGAIVGLATYRLDAGQCELVSLDSLAEGRGIATALVDKVAAAARAAGCRRLWLITTNDNLRALRFYQKRGFVLVAVHR